MRNKLNKFQKQLSCLSLLVLLGCLLTTIFAYFAHICPNIFFSYIFGAIATSIPLISIFAGIGISEFEFVD